MVISAEELFNVLRNEKKTGELQPLPKNFYEQAAKTATGAETKEGGQQQSVQKAINAIKERRTQKILIYLAYGRTPTAPMPLEEEELYNQIKKILKSESNNIKATKIKITAHIPEIITTTGNKIGPYEQNEVIELYDKEDVKFIVDNKIGETTNQ